jgi:hypothetical protein
LKVKKTDNFKNESYWSSSSYQIAYGTDYHSGGYQDFNTGEQLGFYKDDGHKQYWVRPIRMF